LIDRATLPAGQLPSYGLAPVSVHETLAVPNLEASADAWHVYPMGVFYRGVVIVMLSVDVS
jgi:hypothetical protein